MLFDFLKTGALLISTDWSRLIVSCLFVITIHEMGHAFVIALFKGKINKISIGMGREIIRFKKLSIGVKFYHGEVNWDASAPHINNIQKFFILIAGALPTLVAVILLFSSVDFHSILLEMKELKPFHFVEAFVLVAMLNLVNYIPVKKLGTDGYLIKTLFQNGVKS
ncbi:site-2 protease family protein (plasmid) [Aneurinibacillus sp. Ricciae_BoGa-3]|uniref:site-2 protease family protein n=1 Tax=Aneurinibacillus sp. Ricciae_BoGa-3 TaxID=3022697 RepID=UPI0023421B41|nr:site-2 protease family protein [Aneurinibacillus sp. Ricciae_BoGa-3]WCK57449.1 site-2 protease family protein [Aneurinibacillus sp. Ricciae_BoGa-3]